MRRTRRVMGQRGKAAWAGIGALLIASSAAWGIVLHPGAGEPNYVEWVDRPADVLIGRWGNNASCVAVSPNYVVTTRHQGGGVGTMVQIAGRSYRVDRTWNHPLLLNGDGYVAVDVCVARLEDAQLEEYAKLYRGDNEVVEGGTAVMGGWGVGRGKDLRTLGTVYGYRWADEANTTLRWCTNRIDRAQNNVSTTSKSGSMDKYHNYLIADFDDPGATVYEGAVAGFDSGGGWFIRVEGEWQLVGISWGTEHGEQKETWYRLAENPFLRHADRMYALRVSSYAGWIDSVLDNECQDPPPGDYNFDCRVDVRDVEAFAEWWLYQGCSWWDDHCQRRDLNSDGWVDMSDFARLVAGFEEDTDDD